MTRSVSARVPSVTNASLASLTTATILGALFDGSVAVGSTPTFGVQRFEDRLGRAPPDTGHLDDLVDGGGLQLFQRPEPLEQGFTPHLAQPGHVVERRRDHPLGPLLPVIG